MINTAALGTQCTLDCRLEHTKECPEDCQTLNEILTQRNGGGKSPMDVADKLRKTYENALNNKEALGGVNTGKLDENGRLKTDPIDGSPNTPANYNPNNNALIPSINNPIDPNNTSPSKGPNNNMGVGDNLLPPVSTPNGTPSSDDINNYNPTGPKTPTHNDPYNLLDTAPRGTPQGNGPQNSPQQRIVSIQEVPALVKTVVSYIPQVTTITVSSPPVIVHDKPKTQTLVQTQTVTQPPVYIRIPPQTYIQTLPASTKTEYKLDTVTQIKTFVQPVELPQVTLTSYAPVQTTTEEKIITSVIKLPPCTKTIQTVLTQPATTVYVVKTKAVPTEMNIKLHTNEVRPTVSAAVPITPDVTHIALPNSNLTYLNTPNGVIPIFNGSGQNINHPFVLDLAEIKKYCLNNTKDSDICHRLKETKCNVKKMDKCYSDLLKGSYNMKPKLNTKIVCTDGNIKQCDLDMKEKPVEKEVKKFYENKNNKKSSLIETPNVISELGKTGLLEKLKSMLKTKKKESKLVETDIGEAYNEKGMNRSFLLSDLLR